MVVLLESLPAQARPYRSVGGVELAVVGGVDVGPLIPLPTKVPPLPPPRTPDLRTHKPTVFPGGRVVWRQPQPPSLDDARTGKRADISNLHDKAISYRADIASLDEAGREALFRWCHVTSYGNMSSHGACHTKEGARPCFDGVIRPVIRHDMASHSLVRKRMIVAFERFFFGKCMAS